jgi:hypothetical protein
VRKAEAAASADVRMENRREVLQITLQNVQGMPTPLNEHGKLMTLTDLKTHGAKQAVRVCLLYKPEVSAKDEFIGNAYRTLAVQPEKSRFQDFWTFENDADGEFGDNQILIQAEPPKESEDASRDAPAELSDDEEGEDGGKKPAKSKSVPKSMKNKKFQSIEVLFEFTLTLRPIKSTSRKEQRKRRANDSENSEDESSGDDDSVVDEDSDGGSNSDSSLESLKKGGGRGLDGSGAENSDSDLSDSGRKSKSKEKKHSSKGKKSSRDDSEGTKGKSGGWSLSGKAGLKGKRDLKGKGKKAKRSSSSSRRRGGSHAADDDYAGDEEREYSCGWCRVPLATLLGWRGSIKKLDLFGGSPFQERPPEIASADIPHRTGLAGVTQAVMRGVGLDKLKTTLSIKIGTEKALPTEVGPTKDPAHAARIGKLLNTPGFAHLPGTMIVPVKCVKPLNAYGNYVDQYFNQTIVASDGPTEVSDPVLALFPKFMSDRVTMTVLYQLWEVEVKKGQGSYGTHHDLGRSFSNLFVDKQKALETELARLKVQDPLRQAVVRMWPAYETHCTSHNALHDDEESYDDRMKRLRDLRHITSMTRRPTAMTVVQPLGARKLSANERNWAGDQTSLNMVTTAEIKAPPPAGGEWTSAEHDLFVEAHRKHKEKWDKVSLAVGTRTAAQCKAYQATRIVSEELSDKELEELKANQATFKPFNTQEIQYGFGGVEYRKPRAGL